MPAHNEALHIVPNIMETIETLRAFEYDFELIVVNDGSTDETGRCLAELALTFPECLRIVSYDENVGKGNALICGSQVAEGELVAFLDADMDLHPMQLPVFLGIMEALGADVVIGSKWHPASKVDYPFMRRAYSRAYYALVRLLFGFPFRDTQTGIKLFRANVLRHVLPKILVKRFAFDLELLVNVHHLGYSIAEAPITLDFRRQAGRLKWRDIASIFADTAAVFFRLKILKYYDRVDGAPAGAIGISDSLRERMGEDATL